MSAVEALRLARRNGIHLGVAGDDLILDADREPAPRVLAAIRRHKAGIVALLTAAEDDWTAEDWRVFHDERAGIAEFDGGQTRAEAEALAFECCIVEWLNRHPELSDPGRCAWCGKPDPLRRSSCATTKMIPSGPKSSEKGFMKHGNTSETTAPFMSTSSDMRRAN